MCIQNNREVSVQTEICGCAAQCCYRGSTIYINREVLSTTEICVHRDVLLWVHVYHFQDTTLVGSEINHFFPYQFLLAFHNCKFPHQFSDTPRKSVALFLSPFYRHGLKQCQVCQISLNLRTLSVVCSYKICYGRK